MKKNIKRVTTKNHRNGYLLEIVVDKMKKLIETLKERLFKIFNLFQIFFIIIFGIIKLIKSIHMSFINHIEYNLDMMLKTHIYLINKMRR